VQWELVVAIGIAHWHYFVDIIDLNERDVDHLKSFNMKAMEVVCKEHMIKFHK
jgi:hypothetical protein